LVLLQQRGNPNVLFVYRVIHPDYYLNNDFIQILSFWILKYRYRYLLPTTWEAYFQIHKLFIPILCIWLIMIYNSGNYVYLFKNNVCNYIIFIPTSYRSSYPEPRWSNGDKYAQNQISTSEFLSILLFVYVMNIFSFNPPLPLPPGAVSNWAREPRWPWHFKVRNYTGR